MFASCFADRKKGMSLARQIKKRFSRSKKRSHSAERSSNSLREGSNYLQPPDSGQGKPQSKGSSASLFCSSAIVVCDSVDIHQSLVYTCSRVLILCFWLSLFYWLFYFLLAKSSMVWCNFDYRKII